MHRRVLLIFISASLVATGCLDTATPGSDGSISTVPNPAAKPTTTARPTTTTRPAPAQPAPSQRACLPEVTDGYDRPYAPTAPWNVRVCNLAEDARSDDWRDRFWYYSQYNPQMASANPQAAPNRGAHGVMFGFDEDPVNDFSVAVYSAADATTTIRVFQRDGWHGLFNRDPGGAIPWKPAWRASTGADALMVILDPTTGHQWSLWGVAQSYYGLPINDSQCWYWAAAFWLPGGGYRSGLDLCVGGADKVMTADRSARSNYRTYGGNNPVTRGVGIDEYAMLTMPEEVAAGQIRHALMMPVYNTMTGPTKCTSAQMATEAFGSTCGYAVSPAGNFERSGISTQGCGEPTAESMDPAAYRRTTIPEGTRYALDMTESEIETWLDSRGYTGALRSTARTFARALVNYGWFITDTSCFAADFQVAGAANPQTAAAWRALGITGDGRDLLYGLITRERVWTVAPPVNHCTNGTLSTAACPANTSLYATG